MRIVVKKVCLIMRAPASLLLFVHQVVHAKPVLSRESNIPPSASSSSFSSHHVRFDDGRQRSTGGTANVEQVVVDDDDGDPLALRLGFNEYGGLTLPLFPSYEEERNIEAAIQLERQTKEEKEANLFYQRNRRMNRTQEQIDKDSAITRARYKNRQGAMNEEQLREDKLRLREKNKSYYQRILKPRKEALRSKFREEVAASAVGAGAAGSGSGGTGSVSISFLSTSSSSPRQPSQTSADQGRSSIGGPQLSKRGVTEQSKTFDDDDDDDRKEPTAAKEEEEEEEGKSDTPDRIRRITTWRHIPESERSKKQKWYASLDPRVRDQYRARSRILSQERRDAMTEEEKAIEKNKKKQREIKVASKRSEEEKQARSEMRREKRKEYYKQVVKPRIAVRKAAEALRLLAGKEVSTQSSTASFSSTQSSTIKEKGTVLRHL